MANYSTKDLGFDIGLLHENSGQPLEYSLQDLKHLQIRLTALQKGRYKSQVDESLAIVAAALTNIEQCPGNALNLVQQAADSLVLLVNQMSPSLIRHCTARHFVIKQFGQQLSAGVF